MGEDIVQSNHCQGLICVICKPIDPLPRLKVSSVTFSCGLVCRAATCSVQQPLHFSVTLSIDLHYLSTSSSHRRVNTQAFGLRPTSTSNLPLGKQVLMVPGEGIMRDPDIDPVRLGEWQQGTELCCHGHGREVRRHPRFGTGKTLHKGITCPGVVKTGVQSGEAET